VSFPRPAFEVWLPLPTLLMAVPMALFGATFAAAQVASIIEGSIVCVLAWRLAADVAAELGLPAVLARWLGVGTGLAAGAYLPLVVASVQPDSTMPFALLVLAACLLIPRILAKPSTQALAGLGVVLGLAALTRNETVLLGLAWVVLALRWATARGDAGAAVRLVGIPAAVALAIFAPWAIRDGLTFGNPLPGQAIATAFWLNGGDVFAWGTPPTLGRYLAAGLPALVQLRLDALAYNVGAILLGLGLPVSLLGVAGLPLLGRIVTLRPLVVYAAIDIAIATLVFPVASVTGTFIHGAAAIHILLLVSALLALDRLAARVAAARSKADGRRLAIGWVGPALAVIGAAAVLIAVIPADGAAGRETQARFVALAAVMRDTSVVPADDGSPVITDTPIWFATETGRRAIALPDESPTSVVALARTFGATLLVLQAGGGGLWPGVLSTADRAGSCFVPLPLPETGAGEPLEHVVAFRLDTSGASCGA